MSRVHCLCLPGLLLSLTTAPPVTAQRPAVPLATFTGTAHDMDGKTLTVEVNRLATGWTAIGTPRVLEGGVSVASVSPANGLVFSTQGTVANQVTVTLQNARGDTRQLTIALLGAVEVS